MLNPHKILCSEFEEFKKAINTSKHDYHTFSIGTIRNEYPEIRTVVLRAINNISNTISFHTDLRSKKLQDIKSNNHVSSIFYDRKRRIQLRIQGKAYIETDSVKLKEIWKNMRPESKLCYMGPHNPSKKLDSFQPNLPKHDAQNISFENDIIGYNNFSRITIRFKSLDWLHLHHEGHKRLLFSFNQKITYQWIAS